VDWETGKRNKAITARRRLRGIGGYLEAHGKRGKGLLREKSPRGGRFSKNPTGDHKKDLGPAGEPTCENHNKGDHPGAAEIAEENRVGQR